MDKNLQDLDKEELITIIEELNKIIEEYSLEKALKKGIRQERSETLSMDYPYREWLFSFYRKEKISLDKISYLERYSYIYLDEKLKKPKYKLTTFGDEVIKYYKEISPSLRIK